MKFGLAAFFFLCAAAAQAQGVRATVVGRVTDGTGASVPRTRITVLNNGTNEARTATTDNDGGFAIAQLSPGEYVLSAEHEGFQKEVRAGLVLETGQQARVDLVLRVGSLTEQVEVTA